MSSWNVGTYNNSTFFSTRFLHRIILLITQHVREWICMSVRERKLEELITGIVREWMSVKGIGSSKQNTKSIQYNLIVV